MVKIRKLWTALGFIGGGYAVYKLMLKYVDVLLKNDKSKIDLDLTKKGKKNVKRRNIKRNIRKRDRRG